MANTGPVLSTFSFYPYADASRQTKNNKKLYTFVNTATSMTSAQELKAQIVKSHLPVVRNTYNCVFVRYCNCHIDHITAAFQFAKQNWFWSSSLCNLVFRILDCGRHLEIGEMMCSHLKLEPMIHCETATPGSHT